MRSSRLLTVKQTPHEVVVLSLAVSLTGRLAACSGMSERGQVRQLPRAGWRQDASRGVQASLATAPDGLVSPVPSQQTERPAGQQHIQSLVC